MTEMVCILLFACHMAIAIKIFLDMRKDYRRKEDFYDKAFEAYQREYLCKAEKDIQREVRRFGDCKYLVYNELKKK